MIYRLSFQPTVFPSIPTTTNGFRNNNTTKQHNNTQKTTYSTQSFSKATLIIADNVHNFHTDCWKGWHFSATHEVTSFYPFLFLTSFPSPPHGSLELDHSIDFFWNSSWGVHFGFFHCFYLLSFHFLVQPHTATPEVQSRCCSFCSMQHCCLPSTVL